MRWLGRQIRRLLVFWATLAVMLTGLHLATRAPFDPERQPTPSDNSEIWVIDHGFHTGVIVTPPNLRRAAIEIGREDQAAAQRLRWLANLYPGATWLEIGWGDGEFYPQTPGIEDTDPWLALRAIAWPTVAVIQVVPIWGTVEENFPTPDKIRLSVDEAGLNEIARRLAATVPELVPVEGLGPSLYGHGAFFPARLDYHLFRTCNHWTAWILRGAGMPASPVPGTFSQTLMAELRWRVSQ